MSGAQELDIDRVEHSSFCPDSEKIRVVIYDGAFEAGSAQVRADEIGPAEVRIAEVCAAEIGAAEAGAGKVDPGELRSHQLGA